MGKNIHTTFNTGTGLWENKEEHNKQPLTQSKTKEEAQNLGRDLARQNHSEHRIHNKDGKISQSNSYGNDPFPPKDKK